MWLCTVHILIQLDPFCQHALPTEPSLKKTRLLSIFLRRLLPKERLEVLKNNLFSDTIAADRFP